MKIIAFTKINPKYENAHPQEDSFKYKIKKDKIIIAVADGITRDLINGKYPNPSPARKAADLFCEAFLKKPSFEYVNEQIKWLNQKSNPRPDYLENDFWACVGIGGIIKNNYLSCEFIADCGLVIFDQRGELKFRTLNEGPNSKGSIDDDVKRKYNIGFNESKGRRRIRSKYRNNPKQQLAYGALTGEDFAMHYVRRKEFKVQEGDYIIFYTDGFAPILYSNKFNISREFNTLERYFEDNIDKIDGKEGTLVVCKIE